MDWEWVKTEEGKRAKYYEITRSGRRAAGKELRGWLQSTKAILSILDVSPEELA